MGAFVRAEENAVYFLSDTRRHKDDEIQRSPNVNLAFAHPGSQSYVSLTGIAFVSNDRAKIKELWNPYAKAWWSGPDDPNIRLLKIDQKSAEYWDSPGKFVSTVLMAFKAITGSKSADLGDNKKVAMS